jgi:hypothetical protein
MCKYRFGVRLDRKYWQDSETYVFWSPGINKNYQITQDSSPLDIFEIFFSTDLFFYEKVAAGLLASAGTEPQVQGQTQSSRHTHRERPFFI